MKKIVAIICALMLVCMPLVSVSAAPVMDEEALPTETTENETPVVAEEALPTETAETVESANETPVVAEETLPTEPAENETPVIAEEALPTQTVESAGETAGEEPPLTEQSGASPEKILQQMEMNPQGYPNFVTVNAPTDYDTYWAGEDIYVEFEISGAYGYYFSCFIVNARGD